MKNSFKIFLPLIALILIFNSCKKQNQEYLLGEWNLISKPVQELEYKWYFNSSKVYVMATDGNENEAAMASVAEEIVTGVVDCDPVGRNRCHPPRAPPVEQ